MSSELAAQVEARLDFLTKPRGSLGRLEELVRRYTAIRGELMPLLERKVMHVFCADHGVSVEGVSAYPSEVTRAMVRNFVRGGAAINVLCRHYGIDSVVVDMGVAGDAVDGALDHRIAQGTRNFSSELAMTRQQAERAVETGRLLAREAAGTYDVLAAGDMGIGNTTSAAAIMAAITLLDAAECAGRGTGIDEAGLERKISLVNQALKLHQPDPNDALGILSTVGGFEIAAMAGYYVGAAEMRRPAIVDGFIAGAAAMLANVMCPSAADSLLFAHLSAERGHAKMLHWLGAHPFFDLGMRLGEGTGAAVLIGVLEASVKLYREMATFADL